MIQMDMASKGSNFSRPRLLFPSHGSRTWQFKLSGGLPTTCLTGQTKWCGGQQAFYTCLHKLPPTEQQAEGASSGYKNDLENRALMAPETWSHLCFLSQATEHGEERRDREQWKLERQLPGPPQQSAFLQLSRHILQAHTQHSLTATHARFCELIIYTPRSYYKSLSTGYAE